MVDIVKAISPKSCWTSQALTGLCGQKNRISWFISMILSFGRKARATEDLSVAPMNGMVREGVSLDFLKFTCSPRSTRRERVSCVSLWALSSDEDARSQSSRYGNIRRP